LRSALTGRPSKVCGVDARPQAYSQHAANWSLLRCAFRGLCTQPRGEAVVTAHCGLSERWPSPPDGIGQRQSDLNFFNVVPTDAAGKRSLAEAGPSQRENAKSCLLLKCHRRRIGRAFSWFQRNWRKQFCDRHHSLTANSELMVDRRSVSQVPVDFLPPPAPLSRGAFFAGNNRLILSNRKPATTKAQATRGYWSDQNLPADTATGTSRESNLPTYRNRRLAGAKEMMAILDKSHNKSDSVSAGITGRLTRMQTKKIGRYSLTREPRCAMGRRSHSQVCPRGHIAKCSHPVCQNFPRR
jgi:hypothetical protein